MNMNAVELHAEIMKLLECNDVMSMLEREFPGESDTILSEISRGVDTFAENYRKDIDEKAILQDLEQLMANKTPAEQLHDITSILANLSNEISGIHGLQIWRADLAAFNACQNELAQGFIHENDLKLVETLAAAKQLLVDHIMYAEALFTALPEEHLQSFMDAGAYVEDLTDVEGRALVMAIAAAVYALARKGKLDGVAPDSCAPYAIGIQTCMHLAVTQSLSADEDLNDVLKTIRKIYHHGLKLLVLAALSCGCGCAGVLFASATSLSMSAGIAFCIGMAMGWEFSEASSTKAADCIVRHSFGPMVRMGKAVIKTYRKVSDWVVNTVVPALKPLCIKARDFVYEKIIVPVVRFAMAAAEKAEACKTALLDQLIAVYDHVGAMVTRLIKDVKTRAEETPPANAAETDVGAVNTAFWTQSVQTPQVAV